MKLEPPDLSRFIRAKFTSLPPASERTVSPLGISKSGGVKNLFPPLNPPVLNEGRVGVFASKNSSANCDKASAGAMSFIQSLGLPLDALSSSVISFFTFFSLPLDVHVLKRIRREVLEGKNMNGKSADAAALAASAAFDKGVSLSDEALKEYAAAIDPSEHKSPFEHGDAHSDSGGTGFEQTGQHQHRGNGGDQEIPLADDIKRLLDEIDANGSLLGYLNKIPGKNGQYWIVLPFNFMSEGIEFSVSLRILIDARNDLHHSVEKLAVDVLANERRWFFLVSRKNDASYNGKIAVSPCLPLKEQSLLLAELREILGNFVSDMGFIDENDILSFIDSRGSVIVSVDEEV